MAQTSTSGMARGNWREKCGLFIGGLLAPITSAVSSARHARTFHPDGVVYRAAVTPRASDKQLVRVAERLGETALVRFSSALWRSGHEWPDVLGAALRFQHDQDLLLATIRFPWTMPFAPFATNFRSFSWNHYHAVSPFEVDGIGAVKLRLRSPRLGNAGPLSREEQLRKTVAEGQGIYVLELRRLELSIFARHWEPLASVALEGPLEVDQAALRFSPFRAGAGIRPTGFVHALRFAAYAASQEARPTHQ